MTAQTRGRPSVYSKMALTGSPVVAVQMRADAGKVGPIPEGLNELIDGIVAYAIEPRRLYVR